MWCINIIKIRYIPGRAVQGYAFVGVFRTGLLLFCATACTHLS
jgi:hypothetical protein